MQFPEISLYLIFIFTYLKPNPRALNLHTALVIVVANTVHLRVHSIRRVGCYHTSLTTHCSFTKHNPYNAHRERQRKSAGSHSKYCGDALSKSSQPGAWHVSGKAGIRYRVPEITRMNVGPLAVSSSEVTISRLTEPVDRHPTTSLLRTGTATESRDIASVSMTISSPSVMEIKTISVSQMPFYGSNHFSISIRGKLSQQIPTPWRLA